MILLAEHDEPPLTAKKKRRVSASSRPTSTPKNRVWGFENIPSGRPGADLDLSWENAIGSVQFTYETASGRAEWLSRDPFGIRGGVNLYQYVMNDPLKFIDRFGLSDGTWNPGPNSWAGASGYLPGSSLPLGPPVALTLNLRCIGDNLSPDQQLHLTLALGEMNCDFITEPESPAWLMDGIDAVNIALGPFNNDPDAQPLDPMYPDGPSQPEPNGSVPLTEPDGTPVPQPSYTWP